MKKLVGKNFRAKYIDNDDGTEIIMEGKIFDGVDEAGDEYIMLAMKDGEDFWDILPEDGDSSNNAFSEGFKFGWFINPDDTTEDSVYDFEVF